MMIRRLMDALIVDADLALRTIAGVTRGHRASPAQQVPEAAWDAAQRRHSAGLMRVNHVGEVCAQALYAAQGRFARSAAVRQQFAQAGLEEEDHLAWTVVRLHELGARTSLLNPLWYAGAFGMGMVAARLGDAASLGFVVETERQVAAHLAGHLASLPPQDAKSRAIVAQMCADEAAHGAAADALGAAPLPPPVRGVMRGMAKVMTSVAYYL